MTAVFLTVYSCDKCGGQALPYETYTSAPDGLDALIERGWVIAGDGQDLCPVHNPDWESFVEWNALVELTNGEV